MEIVIIILAVVYSVWSEIQKKKDEDANIDFNDLTTLDDFFKNSDKPADQQAYLEGLTSGNKPKRKAKKKDRPAATEKPVAAVARETFMPPAEVNYDNLPSLESAGYEAAPARKEVNYDELPSLTGRSYEASAKDYESGNYDNLPAVSGRTNYEEAGKGATSSAGQAGRVELFRDEPQMSHFAISRDDLLKTVILSEVLQRYNINRIYDRIPGIKSDN